MDDWLAGIAAARGAFLAQHGRGRVVLRAAMRSFAAENSFFRPAEPSAHDARIIARHLPDGAMRSVVVSGHTHAAREVRLAGDRLYLNTGTWTDLLSVPAKQSDTDLQRWIDALASGASPRTRRLTYAEVTEPWAGLREWPDDRVRTELPVS